MMAKRAVSHRTMQSFYTRSYFAFIRARFFSEISPIYLSISAKSVRIFRTFPITEWNLQHKSWGRCVLRDFVMLLLLRPRKLAIVHDCRGFTLVEMLVAMGLFMVLSGIAVMNLKELDDPLVNGSAQLAAFFKQVRARAVSSTLAYTAVPVSGDRVETRYGTTCSDASPISDNSLVLELPNGATITDTDWTLCYTARGLPDGNLTVEVYDGGGNYRTVEVFLGGAVRVQ